MKTLTLSGLASGVATLLAGTAAAQAYGAYNPHDVFVSADVLRSSLNASAGSVSGAQYYAASEVVSSTPGFAPASYASGGYTSGTISAPITANIAGPMSGTFSGQITGTITGTITLNQPAPVTTTTYAAPATYVAPAPAPVYTPAPAPVYTPAPVVYSEPVYSEPVYVAPPAPAYVPAPLPVAPPAPAYIPPPVAPVVVEPVVDYCAPWGRDRNFYGQIGGGYAYAGDNVDGLRLASRSFDKNYHIAGGLGVRMRGQGVGCDDHVRVSIQNHYIRHDLPKGGQMINGRRMLNNDAINGEAVFAQVEYAPDLGLGGIRPYIGAGIGAAGMNVGNGWDGYDNDWGFAYKGIAGVTFEVNPKLDLFAEYNYIGVPGVELKTGGGRKDGEIDYDAHLVNVGLRYNF